MHRTTLLLDTEAQRASKRLSKALGVSPSEVMRRALVALQAEVLGVPEEDRRRRVAAFEKLVELSAKVDASAELKRIKKARAEW